MDKIFDSFYNLYEKEKLFPPKENIALPFKYFSDKIKCVFIVDYINENGIPLHSSNVSKKYMEQEILLESLINDPYIKKPKQITLTNSYSLEKWFDQGILIIPSLFVDIKKATQDIKNIIKTLSELIIKKVIDDLKNKHICYVLIGNESKKYEKIINQYNNLVIPLSKLDKYTQKNDSSKQVKNLIAMKIFTIINNFLKSFNIDEINWMSIYY